MTIEDLTGRPGAYDPAPGTSRYDTDPEALAWARAKIQREIDQLRKWEQKDTDEGDLARASQWRKMRNMLRMKFIGGEGCTIAGFDERRPEMAKLTGGVPAPFPLRRGDRVTITATVVDTPDPEDDPGWYTLAVSLGGDDRELISLTPEQVAQLVRRA